MSEFDKTGITRHSSAEEETHRHALYQCLQQCPIPADQVLENLGLFLGSKNLARILFFQHLYQQIIDVQGSIVEFGTRWGQNLALLAALRGIYEPFNRHRRLIGFDSFAGFPSLTTQDGNSELMTKGNLSVTENYDEYLAEILTAIEGDNPINHIQKFALYKGDANQQIHQFLKDEPQTIIALAYFDFDLYEPTVNCFNAIKDRLVKGSVIGFDELNDPDSPGETLAVMEAIGLNKVRLKRFPYASRVSYFVYEGEDLC